MSYVVVDGRLMKETTPVTQTVSRSFHSIQSVLTRVFFRKNYVIWKVVMTLTLPKWWYERETTNSITFLLSNHTNFLAPLLINVKVLYRLALNYQVHSLYILPLVLLLHLTLFHHLVGHLNSKGWRLYPHHEFLGVAQRIRRLSLTEVDPERKTNAIPHEKVASEEVLREWKLGRDMWSSSGPRG